MGQERLGKLDSLQLSWSQWLKLAFVKGKRIIAQTKWQQCWLDIQKAAIVLFYNTETHHPHIVQTISQVKYILANDLPVGYVLVLFLINAYIICVCVTECNLYLKTFS